MNEKIVHGNATLTPKFQLDYDLCEYFWLSFSLDNVNQGCCTIKAKSEEEAIDKAKKIHNKLEYDDILTLPVPYPPTELDKLVSREELLKDPNFKLVT